MLAVCHRCGAFITVQPKVGFQTNRTTRTAICLECKNGKKK